MFWKKKKILVTHNGKFHADDLFAATVLTKVLRKDGKSFEIIRTRDEKYFNSADYVFDVGGVHNPAENKFDHHQEGGAGERSNGIPYAAFGLVWKKFGEKYCGSKDLADEIDQRFVQLIDAGDVGHKIFQEKDPDILPLEISRVIGSFNATWNEDQEQNDKEFLNKISWAEEILDRAVKNKKDEMSARSFVEKAYQEAEDKRIVVLDSFWPWSQVMKNHEDVLYVIFPSSSNDGWSMQAVEKEKFVSRKMLPESWAGLVNEELESVTGVSGVKFCHLKRFFAAAKTKQAIIELAKLALKD